jgi:preprotein translocase subunit YajC
MMQGHGTIGKITAISGDSFTVSKQDGTTLTVKLNDKTEYRKDRQPAKLADFKVGDFVMVRGDENPDHSVTAQMVGSRTGGPGQGGPGGGRAPMMGEMGKDFVAGRVESIDAPKITVLRTDNVTQTVELNEQTSLRKGRESVTMAEIQPGDHVVVHGALQNNVFVPKSVMVLSPEQWERMQQLMQGGEGPGSNAPAAAPSNNPPHQ